ncbi:Protein of unknown function [Kushneria avicenniae]|uniref:DUF2628 domain-containing protein n=1 Tax=Kushneria avicenniae TaxID=402385 RepID=A0A1I1FP24_9GAMM|nr:DUF2628 domain-containing protein [Kushneria avicenniae]SFB99388.1 Protein of unknown function [Kushneria avicenniae]
MKQFDIYQHADGRLQAVKQGWNWPAFFFGTLWALCCRLWRIAALTIVGILILSVAGALEKSGLLDVVANIVCLGVYVAFGLNGNQWRRRQLLSGGFHFAGSIEAGRRDDAIRRHAECQPPETTIDRPTFQA